MSIIAQLRQISVKQLEQFEKDPSAAYDLILGDSASSARTASEEIQDWKKKNALILLKVMKAGKLENLNPLDGVVFEKAHLEFGDIARNRVMPAFDALPKAPTKEPGLSLEKSWHGIHYLLTEVAEGGRPPLSWAVLGDKEIPDAGKVMGYGPAHVLTAHQVSSVSKAIARITKEKFLRKFDLKEMKAARVYGARDTEDREYFWMYFQKLKAFYSQAAKRNSGLLSHLD
jgi:Domain of unknown function (DUF1877)